MAASDQQKAQRARCFGEALRALREEQAMKPAVLAERSGVSLSQVHAIERNEGNPRATTIDALGDALGIGGAGIFMRSEQIEVAEDRRRGG